MGNGARKLAENKEFDENTNPSNGEATTVWASGGTETKKLSLPWTHDNAPPVFNRFVSSSLKYLLLFLNGYFLGIIFSTLLLR